ncbi:MAG: hypothetical protein EOO02_17410, partial [Chitinophagaceae bacterium]
TGITVALIVFTPLRLYIPGYGDVNATKELRELKIKTDSLDQAMKSKDKYLESVRGVLMGGSTLTLDTTALDIPKAEAITE